MDKFTIVSVALVVVLVVALVGAFIFRRRPRKIKPQDFQTKWKELQKLLSNKETWGEAVVDADQLLDRALKRLRFKGGSMGERLVNAQKEFTNHDAVWQSHKLAKKIMSDSEDIKLKEDDVKKALLGFGQALKDIGAFKK